MASKQSKQILSILETLFNAIETLESTLAKLPIVPPSTDPIGVQTLTMRLVNRLYREKNTIERESEG